jgi:hypothetical protein
VLAMSLCNELANTGAYHDKDTHTSTNVYMRIMFNITMHTLAVYTRNLRIFTRQVREQLVQYIEIVSERGKQLATGFVD